MKLKPIEHSFQVTYSYGLYFSENIFVPENPTLKDIVEKVSQKDTVKLLFLVDDGVLAAHTYLEEAIPAYCNAHKGVLEFTQLINIPGGEIAKNDQAHLDMVLHAIEHNKICRHSFVVAIGGGAIIDLVGYASAIAHRGVRLIRIPTTVLSQNDAAVGVKNGVNILGKKNFIGTFEPPFAIINDPNFLSTLQERDWIAGIAEAVKVALIKDKDFFHFIKKQTQRLKNRDTEIMNQLIHRCAELHMQHIAEGGDPFERGSSRPLDFGHWSAHKLEYMTDYKIRHGEAVAKGMALDIIYAAETGLISTDMADDIINVLKEIGFDLAIPVRREKEVETLLRGIEEFREHLGGKLTITLIDGIGSKKDVHSIDKSLMKKAISILNSKSVLKPARG